MFVFLLALGEDCNILVMTRIREESSRIPLRRAVAQALERTGCGGGWGGPGVIVGRSRISGSRDRGWR